MARRKSLYLLVFILTAWGRGAAQSFINPILAGFYPDPSICKVKGDYYIVNSTFSYFLGLPIFHSKNLANWESIGHALNRPEQLKLNGEPLSGGLFAPTIPYYKGRFYIVCTNVSGVGNFIVSAINPKGPWSNPKDIPEVHGIDPSLFFDENSAFIVYKSGAPDGKPLYDGPCTTRIVPFSMQTLSVIGDNRVLVNGGTDISQHPIWIGVPHLLKKSN